jgi:hypothetical protein
VAVMLVYHPAFDVHHAMLRMLRLVESHPTKSLPKDQLRILDFYYLFPHCLAEVQVMKGQVAKKNRFARRANRFNRVPSPKMLLMRMEGIQTAAIHTLAANGLIDSQAFSEGTVIRTKVPLTEHLAALVNDQPSEDREVVEYLATEISKIPLSGENGLKKRTGLLEYRYDPN